MSNENTYNSNYTGKQVDKAVSYSACATVSNNGSTALGDGANASGNRSTALGVNANASGEYSTALGRCTNARGIRSTALGYYTCAISNFSTALGYAANASGNGSTALGGAAIASGTFSTALGRCANANGDYSIALARYANASGDRSTALGHYANASGNNSTALGHHANASGNYSIALGRYASANSNNTACIAAGSHWRSFNGSGTSWSGSSDRNDKTDISTIACGLDVLKQLRPVTFRWNQRATYRNDETHDETIKHSAQPYDKAAHEKGAKKAPSPSVGFLAQEVEEALTQTFGDGQYAGIVGNSHRPPGNLSQGERDKFVAEVKEEQERGLEPELSLAPDNFIPWIVRAIQELDNRVTILEKECNIVG